MLVVFTGDFICQCFFMVHYFPICTSWNRNCMWLLILICMKQPSYVFDVCVTSAIGWDIDDRPSTLAYWLGGYYLLRGPIDLSCFFSPSRPCPLLLRLLLSSPTICWWCSLSPASQIAFLFPFIPRRLWHSPYPSRRSPGFLWTGTAEPVCMNNLSWILMKDKIPSHFRAKAVTLSNYWARRNKDKNGRDKRDSTVWNNEKDTALPIFYPRSHRCCSWCLKLDGIQGCSFSIVIMCFLGWRLTRYCSGTPRRYLSRLIRSSVASPVPRIYNVGQHLPANWKCRHDLLIIRFSVDNLNVNVSMKRGTKQS